MHNALPAVRLSQLWSRRTKMQRVSACNFLSKGARSPRMRAHSDAIDGDAPKKACQA